jgi:hypothetical protein
VSLFGGFLLDFNGPLPGSTDDRTLFRAFRHTLPADLQPCEFAADKGYAQQDLPELLFKPKIPAALPDDARVVLRAHNMMMERGRVLSENCFAHLAHWQLVGHLFRSHISLHVCFALVAASLTQLQLILSPLRTASSDAHQCVFDESFQLVCADAFVFESARIVALAAELYSEL